jgi:hypothetical protein
MGESAVLDIDVGGRRKVDASLVTVERSGGTTIVRIPRSELVDARGSVAVKPTEATKPVETPVTAPTATIAKAVAPSVANDPSETLGTKPAKDKAVTATSSLTSSLASGGDSKLPMLLLMTVVLGAVLGGIKLWQRKSSAFLREPDIEVVASKRIGPGLQLFIVRAFGQEHLLSVNGKSTERIATNEAYVDFDAAADALEKPSFDRPSIGIPSLAVPKPLMSRAPLSNSQSIAGLIRLREQADRTN